MSFPAPISYQVPLDRAALDALGIEPGWPFGIAGRVMSFDVDALNHVNNTTYFRWYEMARTQYCRAIGLTGSGPDAPNTVVRSTECRYIREILEDEDYLVTARTRAFRRTSFTMDYAIWAPDLRATGSAVVVLMAPGGAEKFPIPEAFRRRFTDVDGAAAEGG